MQTSTGGVLLKPAMHYTKSQSVQRRNVVQRPHLALVEIHHSHKVQWVGVVVVVGAGAHVHEALDEASLTGRIMYCRAGQGRAAPQPGHGRHMHQAKRPTCRLMQDDLMQQIQVEPFSIFGIGCGTLERRVQFPGAVACRQVPQLSCRQVPQPTTMANMHLGSQVTSYL